MAWCLPGDKPLSEPMIVSLPTRICVTRPQWDSQKTPENISPSRASYWMSAVFWNKPVALYRYINYLIIIVNRITYSNNRITKNKSRMPLDLYIKLGPFKFSLQASVDHHGYSMNSGHYTASISCCGKTFHCNDNKITECNITDTYNSSTAYILLYKLMEC